MARALIQCLFFVIWLVHLDADLFRDRPKIKTNDGHLILQPASDKNIYLQTNGPKSAIFVGGVNVLNINITGRNSEQPSPYFDLGNFLNGPGGILDRLSRLENNPIERSAINASLWRRVNVMRARISTLETRIQNMVKDHCESHPCLHGGTCLNLASGYHCLCPTNWEGKDCDEDVNECRNYQGTDLGCQNRANCKNTPGSYECECIPGWYGIHCTKRRKDCSGGEFEMCGHGTCVSTSTGEGIKCICNQGWTTNGTGDACLTDVNECESTYSSRCSLNPRVACINLPGTFRCGQCPSGYEGDGYVCSDIDECLTNNGGCSTSPKVTCHNTVGSRICAPCPTGYQGDGVTCTWRGSCSINRGGCHPSAQCIDNSAAGEQMAQCICPQGMEGDGIGLHGCYVSTVNFTRGCDSNPCGIHGQCHPLRSGYTCFCYRGYGGMHCDAAHDYCSSRPCLNGGICRTDESTSRGFRCECTARYTGDLCHMPASTCGGYLRAEEGSIVYPMSNTTYENNVRCAWVINTESNKVINVTFSRFNLEPGNHEKTNEDCKFDFLQIHDGYSSSSQIIGRFCGNEFPKGGNIISSHNYLYFWFRSDSTIVSDGFALHWTSIDPVCGGEIDATVHGRISSPGSPGKYPPNRDCYWHLTTTYGKRIQLHFFSLDIESHSNCSFDFVAIYDGGQITDSLIGRYCSSSIPAPVTSGGSDLLVHFHSDAYSAGYGFQAAFAPADGVPGCGGLYTTDRGEISSPSYGGKYLSGITCDYQIRSTPGTKIRINFKSFNLEFSRACKYDYLKVYDGPSEDSPLVGKFCGTTYPKSYTSSTNQFFLIFRSDLSISTEGFRITFETVCQQVIQGDSGFLISPGYPLSYPANRMCEYFIGTSPGKVIQLTFQDFDIEDNSYFNCQYDNVEIRDGIDVNATLLGRYCGGNEHFPPTQTSTNNYMYVRFSSDMSISGTGFYANFTTLDVECGGIYRKSTGTISHEYSNDQHCIWIIIAPEGMDIQLTWIKFNLESMASCSADFVALAEIDENNENIDLGKYCGLHLPPAITTTTNKLQITFQSDGSVHLDGFSVSYMFLDERIHCGGNYTKIRGTIYSPGWPKRYPANRDCKWSIVAPPGRKISLNITQFDIERSFGDQCRYGDSLEIRNGASEGSPLIGTYCGRFPSKRIISMSNALYIHFHSDNYISGTGFKIEWDSAVSGCGGILTGTSGSVTSPNYPFNYHENAECFYKIVASQGSKVRLNFLELDLEIIQSRSYKCSNDYVEIFDGRDENAPSLGRFCEHNGDLKAIESTTNYMYIKFRSDYSIEGKGFLLEYSTICQNNLTGLHGVIESPGFPSMYPVNLNCLWIITVPKGSRINITFTEFNIGMMNIPRRRKYGGVVLSIGECNSDYLQIKESTDVNFSAKKCGHVLPGRMTTTGNSLQIKFVTDSSDFTYGNGFRLEWARYGCGGYIRKNFGTIRVDSGLTSRGQVECEWLIEGKQGMGVTINILDLYMEDSKNCTTDAIEIYNGQNTETPLLAKICHRNTGTQMSTVTSTTNLIFIRFVKQSSLKDVQFRLRFDSFHTGCGGRVETLSGVIHSKNYPKNYDNDIDCTWIIEVPKNHRIELNFTDFDLYSIGNSDCDDFIRIYDGDIILSSNYTKLICPNTPITPIISKKNILGVQFLSDNYGTAKGFKANFTITCGATITAKFDGIIENNKWHANHVLDNKCTWTILAPSEDQKISLTITFISIPKDTDIITNRKCPSSFLRVLDGNNADAPLVDEYCGRKVPPMIVSSGSAITIVYGAYNGTAQGQFSAHYSPIMSSCGGILSSEEGSIASPNYPQSYPINSSCEWVLSTSPGNKVYITFEQFDLKSSENCNEDYLEVRENDGSGVLLGLYCGSDIPANTSAAKVLYIKFHSSSENSGQGFVLHYGFLHGNEISGLERGNIASPLYPHFYEGAGEFSWRISTEGDFISIVLIRAEIPTYGPTCSNSLTFYDGYDEQAAILENFCGMLKIERQIKTTTNMVFIKLKLDESNSGSIFYIQWAKSDTSLETSDPSSRPNCGFNETKILTPGQRVTINSPGYPNEYRNDLYCEWLFKAPHGRHANLHFNTFHLEETATCFADSVSVYSSNTPTVWKPVKEEFCLSTDTKDDFNSSNYLKIIFKTDSSITRNGFEAQVSSACGGFMNDLSGTIEPRYEDFNTIRPKNCEWTIKVRPGRQIKLNFEHFNITNTENECTTYITIRNGDSQEAPMLGTGKYCGLKYENREDLVSSSNAVFVTYSLYFAGMHLGSRRFTNFRLHYEEKGVECGGTVALDSNNKWNVFNSPNYPNVPTAYSECVWVFKGPPGEILRIDFLERFDLQSSDDCYVEYVEIRDGSTDIAPLKGRYCGASPSTVKTESNNAYIKYYTQLAEPRNGFKANVSIDVCGGTIRANRGEVTSPGFPRLPPLPSYTKCEWRIIASQQLTLLIKPQDIQLPSSKHNHLCETKITIEELEGSNSTTLKTFCASPFEDYDMTSIQTSTNELVIKLEIGDYSEYNSAVTKRGFRFSFNSSTPSCGGDVSTPEGFLTTTGYPRETTIRYCQWRITVPDKTRRVSLEILDSNLEKHRIGIYNDLHFQTMIKIFPSTDDTETTNVYESTGHTMSVYIWLDSVAMRHRFKARFSSDESSLCGGELHALRGELTSPDLDRAYTCEWTYTPTVPADIANLTTYNTLYVNVKVNTSAAVTRQYCTYSEPKLTIRTMTRGHFSSKRLCGNAEKSFSLPVPEMYLIASNDKTSSLYFNVQWKLNPCGGVLEVSEDPINILNVPNDYNETLDCAWLVSVPIDTRVEFNLEGSFSSDCNNELVFIRQGHDYDDSPNIADYCIDKKQDLPLQLSYTKIMVHYHSNIKDKTNVRLMAKTITDLCGGIITDYQRTFESPNYPKSYAPNLECSWEIRSEMGNRISLHFIDSFRIEEHTNCSKDAVIIYDWKDESWVQMARVCGRSLPPTYNSTDQRMKVVLRTDADIQMDGFRVRWEPLCGGMFNATDNEQFLYSPSEIGVSVYQPHMDCTYSILGGKNKIYMKFLEFALEGTYPMCEYDNLTIRLYENYEYYEDFTYCGSELPSVPLGHKRIDLIFRTDSYVQRKGFKVMYQISSCGGHVDKPTIINSNPNSELYQDDENCTWVVEAPKEKIVVVKFQYIYLEPTPNCRDDHVSVFDSNIIDEDKRLARLCGNMNRTTVIRSTANSMVVQFESDIYVGSRGFKADIFFTYSPAVGCGGEIDLTNLSPGETKSLISPFYNGMAVYENFLDCQWNIRAPTDYSIKIKFTQFHIAPCNGINQTAIGFSKCDCDYVEILDGVNPHDLVIGTYCGHNIPDGQELIASKNMMSVRLYTDGEITSAGFKAELSLQRQVCGQTVYSVGFSKQIVRSPGYATGAVPTGLLCVYHFVASTEEYETLHLKIKTLDLRPGEPDANQCNKDKLLIVNAPETTNASLGKDYITSDTGFYLSGRYTYFDSENIILNPDRFEYCGVKSNVDLYLQGSVTVYLQTSAESDSVRHKGIELEVSYLRFCGRNYTELYGWLTTPHDSEKDTNIHDCFTLITVPNNYTISMYIIKVYRPFNLEEGEGLLDIFDGNTTSSPRLHRFNDYDEAKALFSTGRHILLHNKVSFGNFINYELVYMATDKGKGCGGRIQNIVGLVTSPLYPDRYQKQGTCEWELETPSNTHLQLLFASFDFGSSCDTNYLQLVDRSDKIISTYCEEMPAVYTSTDNYVKIVYTTDGHNTGTGWVADFKAIR